MGASVHDAHSTVVSQTVSYHYSFLTRTSTWYWMPIVSLFLKLSWETPKPTSLQTSMGNTERP